MDINDVLKNKDDYAIIFQKVSKHYKLYKNDKQRLVAIFSKKSTNATKKVVFDNLSFAIRKGASIGILGRNGAGKSTLLKLITGVSTPTRGNIIVNGNVAALLELTVGFDMEATGRENIFFRSYLMGLTEKEIEQDMDKIIEFSELGEYIDQPVRTYSSGMKARLGFAIAIHSKPEILIIDEALSVGDARFSNKCRKAVAEIRKTGVTVLFVSHSISAVRDFCEYCIILKNGKIEAHGDTEEVIAQYS